MSKVEMTSQARATAAATTPLQTKAACRGHARRLLSALDPDARRAASREIVRRIDVLVREASPRAALLYAPLADEPDLLRLLDDTPVAWHFPCLTDTGIVIRPWSRGTRWTIGAHGIREPDTAACPDPSAIGLAVVPGRAFAPDGTRLGRGGGHYDVLLGALPKHCLRIGACFDCQIFNMLPLEPHDMPMEFLVSEARSIDCSTAHGPRKAPPNQLPAPTPPMASKKI